MADTKVSVKWGVDQSEGRVSFTLEELNTTESEWLNMTYRQQRERVEEALNALPDICWPVLESFEDE